MNFQVPWKEVVQRSFSRFEYPFFLKRTTVYFTGPEPLPLAFFDGMRGRVAQLDDILADLDLFLNDYGAGNFAGQQWRLSSLFTSEFLEDLEVLQNGLSLAELFHGWIPPLRQMFPFQ